MIDWILKKSAYLKVQEVQIRKDLDNHLDLLEKRLNDRIDTLLVATLKNLKVQEVQISPNKNKSKTSLRQIQENKVIQAFRHTKKQVTKQKIRELLRNTPISSIKTKLMRELGISKASFYNYLKEIEKEIQVQQVQEV